MKAVGSMIMYLADALLWSGWIVEGNLWSRCILLSHREVLFRCYLVLIGEASVGSLYSACETFRIVYSCSSCQSNLKKQRNLSHSEPHEEYRLLSLNNHAVYVCFYRLSLWKQQERACAGLASQSSHKMSFLQRDPP